MPSPANLSVPPLMFWIGAVSAAVVAVGIIGRAVWWATKTAGKIDEIVVAIPTILEIGTQFTSGGRSTLRGEIESIRHLTVEASQVAAAAAMAATAATKETAQMVQDVAKEAATNSAILTERTQLLTERTEALAAKLAETLAAIKEHVEICKHDPTKNKDD